MPPRPKYPTSLHAFRATFAVTLTALLLVPATATPAGNPDTLLFEGEGLWILSSPYDALRDWCEFANHPKRSHGVSVYYDVAHEERLKRLGSSYASFVLDKAVPAIQEACGPGTEVTYLGVAMYRKAEGVAPGRVVDDLAAGKTPLWDNALFKIENGEVTTVKHEAREAAYHLDAEQLRALDPRNEAELAAYWAARDQAWRDQAAAAQAKAVAEAEAAKTPATPRVAAPPASGYAATSPTAAPAFATGDASGGQVTKPQEFWDRLKFSGAVRDVFEGDFGSASSTLFKVYYSALQWAYSDSCRDYLPAGSVKRGYVTQTVYADGYRDAGIERSAMIGPRFIGFYDAYSDDVSTSRRNYTSNAEAQARTSLSRGGSVLGIIGQAAENNPINQLSRFISAAGGCETAAVYQLRENFLRAALGQPSLQQAGIGLATAEAESAAPEPSLYGACMARPDPSRNFCLCFEREAEGVLTAAEKQSYTQDFQNYYAAMRVLNTRPWPPASDRVWVLNDLRSRCN